MMSGVGNVGRKHLKWHPSHRFFPNDDILECDVCGCRSYNAEAKKKCVPHEQRRLAYLRTQIEAECISMEELHELQGLAKYIDPSDVLLLEWAGVPEFPDA